MFHLFFCFLFFLYYIYVKTVKFLRRVRFYAICCLRVLDMFTKSPAVIQRQDPALRTASYAEDVDYFLKIAVHLKIVLYGGAVRDMFAGAPIQDLDFCGTDAQLEGFLSCVEKRGCFVSKQYTDQYENTKTCRTRLITLQLLRTCESSVVNVDFNLSLNTLNDIDFDVNALIQCGEALSANTSLFLLKDYAGLNHTRAFNMVVKNIDAKRCTGKIKAGPHFLYRYFKMLRKGYTVNLELKQLRLYKEHAFEGKCLVCQEDGRESKEPSVSFMCACDGRVHLSCFKEMFRVDRSEDCLKSHLDLFMTCAKVQPFVGQLNLLMRQKSKPTVGLEEGAAALEATETLDYETLAALDSEPLKMNKCMLCKKSFNEQAILLELLYIDFSTRLP
jgi:hypothetical protein